MPQCLHEAGAEVWLLTEFFDKLSKKGLRNLPKKTQEMIHNARILNNLAQGRRDPPINSLQTQFRLARKARKLGPYFRFLVNILRRPRRYKSRELNSFELKELYDNPYIRVERLSYLECVTGIVSAPELFASQLAAELPNLRPVTIDLERLRRADHNLPTQYQPTKCEHLCTNYS